MRVHPFAPVYRGGTQNNCVSAFTRKLPGDPLSLPMDVRVDTHDFRPWHVDEIRAVMKIKADAGEQRAQDAAFRVERDE
jgi:hypothetical protein